MTALTPEFLKQLEIFNLRARRAFLGSRQGGHRSLKRGHGLEFFDYRQYQLGDNPRHIDWGVYGRTERLVVKRFEEEQDLSVLVFLDSSASMTVPADSGKWELARHLAFAVSYIAVMQQDTVVLATSGGVVSPRFTGPRSVARLLPFIDSAQQQGGNDFIRGLQRAVSSIRFPGVCIVISDMLYPMDTIEKAFNILRAKNLDITALRVLAPADVDVALLGETDAIEDSETGEVLELSVQEETAEIYRERFEAHEQQLIRYLEQHRVPVITSLSDEDPVDVIIRDLPLTGLFV